jgi:hypothetical protein
LTTDDPERHAARAVAPPPPHHQLNQRALDRGLTPGRDDLRAEKIRHIHVDQALAKGRHTRGGDVEVELRERRGEFVEQADRSTIDY